MNGSVVVLSGGTGGAKLARGLLDVVGPDRLTVIANTGDDVEIYGGYVCPDPDLVSFWLADRIDPRGWGLDGDSFRVMDMLRELGQEIWFNLGDQDLAIALRRAQRLAEGQRLTETQLELNRQLGVSATILPMSDRPVRTRVLAAGRWRTLQEFLILDAGRGEVQDVQFHGAQTAGTTPEVLRAIADAGTIVVGPSNPVLSIGPLLAIGELRHALVAAGAPVVAVSPIVGGEVLKGPTATFMRYRGVEPSAAGIARLYGGVINGIVSDEPLTELPSSVTNLMMEGHEGRRRLAEATLDFASTLASNPQPSSFPAQR